MATAFQQLAFQTDGFQITASTPPISGAGSVNGVSVIAGAALLLMSMSASVAGVATPQGRLSAIFSGSSAVSGTSSVAGSIMGKFFASAAVVGTSVVTGFGYLKMYLGSAVAGVSVVTGNLVAAGTTTLRRIPVYLHGQIRHWRHRHGR